MKKLFIVMSLLFAMNSFAEEVKIKVSGMVCSMCAQGIQKKFSKEEAVHHLSVNMDEKIVLIQTKDGKQISDETIKKLISEAGYNVAAIERK